MLCSSCLVAMRRKKGVNTCPRCGRTGSIFFEDGSEADIRPIHARGPRPAWGFMSLLLLVPALAGAAWWAREDLAAMLMPEDPPAARLMSAVDIPAPGLRPQGAAGFGALSEALIAIVGTGGQDRLKAFAILEDGGLAALIEPGNVSEDPSGLGSAGTDQWLVRLDGTGAPETRRIAFEGPLAGAALAPLQGGGFALALAGPGGGFVEGWKAAGEPAWRRPVPPLSSSGHKPLLLDAGDLIYLAAPSERAGFINISALDLSGALVWQRSFETGEGAGVRAALTAEGGLVAAFEAAGTSGEPGIRLVELSREGEMRRETRLRTEGPLAGLAVSGAETFLLLGSAPPVLLSTGEGASSVRRLGDAVLHDSLHLLAGPTGLQAVAAYSLSDITTDLLVFGEGAGPLRQALPPHTRLHYVAPVGAGSLLIAGETGEGAAADIFVLVITNEAGAGAETSEGAGLEALQ